MNSMRKAVLLASFEQQFALAANFIIAVLTSRLMFPDEIGVTVVGAAIVGIFASLREFATSTFLIKNGDLPPADIHGALTGIIVVNIALVLALVAMAPAFGGIYSDARLTSYLRVMAIGLMCEAFATPVVAILRREMLIDRAASISASGTSVMLIITLILAVAGFGYMSFAIGYSMGMFVSAAVGVYLRPRFWRARPSFRAWRMLFEFGGYNGTQAILRQLYESVPYVVLGHVLSFEVVAFYHRALMLAQLPGKLLLNGIENLMLPKLIQHLERSRSLKEPFLLTIRYVTAIYWPTLVILALLAHPIVRILYGEAWLAAAPLVQIMALAALLMFIGKLDTSILVATDGMPDILRRSLIVFPTCAIITTLSATIGVTVLAASYWITYALQLLSSLYFIRKHVSFTPAEFLDTVYSSAIVTAASAAGPLLVVIACGGAAGMSLVATLLAGVLAVVGWLLALKFTNHELNADLLAFRAVVQKRSRT